MSAHIRFITFRVEIEDHCLDLFEASLSDPTTIKETCYSVAANLFGNSATIEDVSEANAH